MDAQYSAQNRIMKPLNPYLYRLLKDYFGQVRVSNAGVKQMSTYVDRIGGEKKLDLIEPGEYYQVCCPYCNDTRFRLYINHMWGHTDKLGRRNLWMAICYNENCLAKFERVSDLMNRLTDPDRDELASTKILQGKEIDPEKIVIDWPGPVTRVDKLPRGHKAVRYLLSRNFDPQVIGRFYNVHYCPVSFRYLAQDRLIIPIYMNKRLMGWQARYIGELKWSRDDSPPKYYTAPGTPRRLLVYNLANATNYQTGVIMEGPTDVWSFGPMGVCTLGSTMTMQQIRRFTQAFHDHSVVLLYDPDVREDKKKWPGIEKMIARLESSLPKGLAVVWLPKGRDPGSLDRAFLRGYVVSEAKNQGVKVSWRRR
jgi:hypothetical protein